MAPSTRLACLLADGRHVIDTGHGVRPAACTTDSIAGAGQLYAARAGARPYADADASAPPIAAIGGDNQRRITRHGGRRRPLRDQ